MSSPVTSESICYRRVHLLKREKLCIFAAMGNSMISFEEAFQIVCDQQYKPKSESIPFTDTVGRVLAKNIRSDIHMPPFDKTAVDGFACRKADLVNPLEIIEVIPAGTFPTKEITVGTCARIMTGAPIPKGADMVLMIENTEETKDGFIRTTVSDGSSNICFFGEDICKDEVVLKKGTRIKPQHIAVMAGVGAIKPEVYIKASVGIMSTGNELVEPNQKPNLSQIRNSNSWQLMAQVERAGGIPRYFGIIPDNIDDTKNILNEALRHCDMVILSGGVSAGDFDFVPRVITELGFNILFDSIAVQPGRPTTLASGEGKYILGLPGNPVSSFVQFELLGKILLHKMMGASAQTGIFISVAGSDFKRKKASRKSFYPVMFNQAGEVIPIEYHGSAHINALNDAIGVVSMDSGVTLVKKGELVNVRPL